MKSVLLVDDSIVVLTLLERIMPKLNFHVCATARNGKEAVTLYREHKPSLVIMDVTMPVQDGLEAAAEIISADTRARIIMLTAMADREIRATAQKIGVSIFMKKPFAEQQIKEAVFALFKEEQDHAGNTDGC